MNPFMMLSRALHGFGVLPANDSLSALFSSTPGSTKPLTLLTLPTDILLLILDILHKDDINAYLTFSLVSRASRSLCESGAYNTVVINDSTKLDRQICRRIMTRILNSDDRLSHVVRHLIIGPFNGKKIFSTRRFADLLQSIQYLKSLTWNTHRPITPAILKILQNQHPEARLNYANTERNNLHLDERLLSSPQLHSLNITASCCGFDENNNTSGASELPHLKECLIRGGSIKNLRLSFDFEPRVNLTGPNQPLNFLPLNFPFQDGDIFPALEELSLHRGEHFLGYNLSSEHCNQWVKCMDWSHLKVLQIHGTEAAGLFEAITNKVPQLKSLDVGACHNISVLSAFVASIDSLEYFRIQVREYYLFESMVGLAISRHGRSLTSLSLQCSYGEWEPERYVDILRRCPKLSHVQIRMGRQRAQGNWTAAEIGMEPENKYMTMKKKDGQNWVGNSYDGAMGHTQNHGFIMAWDDE